MNNMNDRCFIVSTSSLLGWLDVLVFVYSMVISGLEIVETKNVILLKIFSIQFVSGTRR